MDFAWFEMSLILASIIPHVNMELIPGQDLTPTRMGLAIVPPSGVRVKINSVSRAVERESVLAG